jgi:ribonuclease P protein component
VKQAFSSQTATLSVSVQAFKKSSRLLNASDFQAVFDDAPLRTSHQHFLLLARLNSLGHSRLGLVIAKKHIRLSVQRNRVKRLIRETFRVKQQQISGIDVIVLARKGMDQLSNASIIEHLDLQWQRLIRKLTSAPHKTQHNPQTDSDVCVE